MSTSLVFTGPPKSEKQLIEKYDYHKYYPQLREYINDTNRRTFININSQDAQFDTANSNIILNGQILCEGVDLKDDYKNIKFIRNGYMHMFSNIEYKINNKVVQEVNSPGYTMYIKGLMILQNNSTLEGWDGTNLINDDGYFSISVPFKYMFSVFEKYNKPILRVSQSIEFLRNTSDANCLIITGTSVEKLKDKNIKVELSDIIWEIPHITPIIDEKIKINKLIESNKFLTIPFLDWAYTNLPTFLSQSKNYSWSISTLSKRPQYVIVALQTNKEFNYAKNNSEFDFCDVENIKLLFSEVEYYPVEDLDLNKKLNIISRLYSMYSDAKKTYYPNMDPILLNNIIKKTEFIKKYPLFVFDLTYKSEFLKETPTNLTIRFTFEKQAPTNTMVHCVTVSESYVAYSPGNNLLKKE